MIYRHMMERVSLRSLLITVAILSYFQYFVYGKVPVFTRIYDRQTKICSRFESCSECFLHKQHHLCGWCQSNCVSKQAFRAGGIFFLKDGRVSCKNKCPDPTIFRNTNCEPSCPEFKFEVSPKKGYVNGGTELTLKSPIFRQLTEHIDKKFVYVSGCNFVSWKNVEINNSITCLTVKQEEELSANIIIKLRTIVLTSVTKFSFVFPKLFGINPRFGPKAGGTKVTLFGKNLDIECNRTVTLAGEECKIYHVEESRIMCISSPFGLKNQTEDLQEEKGQIVLKVDNEIISDKINGSWFEYREDPFIHSVSLRPSIFSGGINLTVSGQNFKSVNRIFMGVTFSNIDPVNWIFEVCLFGNPPESQLLCPTPTIKTTNGRNSFPIKTFIYFRMDALWYEWSETNKSKYELDYYPNPIFHSFPENRKYFTSDMSSIEIKGTALNQALRLEDIKVNVNETLDCIVTQLNSHALHCSLEHLNETIYHNVANGTHLPVSVKAGNLETSIGDIVWIMPLFSNNQEVKESAANSGIVITVCVLAILSLFVITVIVCKRIRKENLLSSKKSIEKVNEDEKRPPQGERYFLRRKGSNIDPKTSAVGEETINLLNDDQLIIDINYLSLAYEVGEGQFGRVFKGKLQRPGEENSLTVAVKTSQHGLFEDAKAIQSFLQEAQIMKDLDHRNVLTMIGICFEDNGLPMVVLPFMDHGDLRSYIKDKNIEPTIGMLVEFGFQIAKGMRYLESQKLVHRDLAARNCLLDKQLEVKVADFGLSRDIYEKNYYSSDNKKSAMPIRWMAPESLEKNIFSNKSDVWSFGVVLWELVTRGVQPYPDVGTHDILQYIKKGRRMWQPTYCPNKLYQIMLMCWKEKPEERPSFVELPFLTKDVLKRLKKPSIFGHQPPYVNEI